MPENIRKINLPPLNLQWLSNLPPAFVSSVIITIISTAAISTIFKGILSPYLSIGISCALIGAVIVNLISKYKCVFPFAVSCMTPNASVVMGLFLHEIASVGLPERETFYTIFAAFLVTAFLTALILYLVGTLKIGKMIRYMPYPVVCGFFAGVGWYLFVGALTIVGIDVQKISFSQDMYAQILPILPSILFAMVAFFINKVTKSPFAYIAFIGLSMGSFFIYMISQDMNFTEITASTLTVESPKIEFLFEYLDISILNSIHWSEIFTRWGYILSFAAVNLLSLLAYAVNFEETSRTSVDLDREVKSMGFSNLIATFFTGGTTIFTTQSLTHRATGANHSISVLYVSIFCLIILFFSNHIIPIIPKFVVSGILITNGLMLVDKWLVKLYSKMSWIEWGIVAAIFLVMIFQGFIPGVGIGLSLAFIWVIVNNSRMEFIRFELLGPEVLSNATYPLLERQYLQEARRKVYFIKLQGYFFFGSAERLFKYIKNKVFQKNDPKVEYLILDFNFVSDIDSTAIHSLIKLEHLLRETGCSLILTGLNKRCRKHLGMAAKSRKKLEFIPYFKSMELKTKTGKIYVFEDADAGIEWVERHLIEAMPKAHQTPEQASPADFLAFLTDPAAAKTFRSFLKKVELKKGEKLITPEHPDHSMYFIESGAVAYLLRKKGKGYKRIREFGPGHLIGEIQFYMNEENKDVKIDCIEDCVFHKLTHKRYEKLAVEHPQLALKLSNWVVQIMSERHTHLAREIKYLL